MSDHYKPIPIASLDEYRAMYGRPPVLGLGFEEAVRRVFEAGDDRELGRRRRGPFAYTRWRKGWTLTVGGEIWVSWTLNRATRSWELALGDRIFGSDR